MTSKSYSVREGGYSGLDWRPYQDLEGVAVPRDAAPPYETMLGRPSYEVCAACAFEFGNDDNPGTAPPVTFEEHRTAWLARGAPWFLAKKRPETWDAETMLIEAGLQPVGHYFIHDGWNGWSWGSPLHPRSVDIVTAHAIMLLADISESAVLNSPALEPVRYAEIGDDVYRLTGGNRFLAFGDQPCRPADLTEIRQMFIGAE